MTTNSLADFVADRDTGKDRWSLAAAAAVLTVVCVGLIIWGGLAGLVAGILGTVFVGMVCLPFIAIRALRPVPPLVVAASGFVLQRHASDPGLVTWDEVDSIGTTVVGRFSRVVVRLRDPAGFVSGRSPATRPVSAPSRHEVPGAGGSGPRCGRRAGRVPR